MHQVCSILYGSTRQGVCGEEDAGAASLEVCKPLQVQLLSQQGHQVGCGLTGGCVVQAHRGRSRLRMVWESIPCFSSCKCNWRVGFDLWGCPGKAFPEQPNECGGALKSLGRFPDVKWEVRLSLVPGLSTLLAAGFWGSLWPHFSYLAI